MAQTFRQSDGDESALNAIYLKQYVDANANSLPRSQDADNSTVYSQNTQTKEDEQRWQEFKIYSSWNAIRFTIIAAIICFSNYQNQHQIETYRPYCCHCYYVALNPEQYNIKKGYRIDWSYCMPQCVDCEYCRDHYNNNGISQTIHSISCLNHSNK